MRYQDIFTEQYSSHLYEYDHFKNEFMDKTPCKFGDECYAYKRLSEGGNELKDRCHVQIYRHPPRYRKSKPSDDIHSFCLNDDWNENIPSYKPTQKDEKKYEYNKHDGYLKALIEEVTSNGYRDDLYLKPDDDRKSDNYAIMNIVKSKLNCMRHKQMGSPLNKAEMLSIILYTGCDSNYDLCKSQRSKDYTK